ncbi:MAG: DUF1553 domain-containing protein [Planctomycetes bacterium]|nr:DUF1553 domain-containing protein [Planctomycetota bacterium]
MRLSQVCRGTLIAAWLLCAWAELRAEPADVQFNRDIRPLLSDKCFACHGPDANSREADLRLDTHEGAFGERDDVQVLVAGNPEDSELFCRIASSDPDEQMPPPDSEQHLNPDEIALFKRWIEQGAKWQRHWSFITPTRPELPEVSQSAAIREPIDRFVLARLEKEQLSFSAEADRRTLIRRVTFDLTGLPPRWEEVQAFVADQSPDAYEKVVDRLLASKHYGEHMSRFWLDAARYGDTHGLHLDNYREMWPYRDWVITAFNANMPYDQFLVEQLAGDLLPEATLDQQVASGFNRCHVSTNEGGSIDEEVYVRNVVDRVSTVGTVCLGLTVGCAVCHDHKFDPFTQKEFYQLFAFFNSLDGQSMDGNVKDPAPTVRVPTAEQVVTITDLNNKIKSFEKERTDRLQVIEPEFQAWLTQQKKSPNNDALGSKLGNQEGLLVYCKFEETEGDSIINLANLESPGKLVGSPPRITGKIGRGIEFTKEGYVDLGNVGDFKKDQQFSFGAWVKSKSGSEGPIFAKLSINDRKKGYELSTHNRQVVVLLSGRLPGYVIEVKTTAQVLNPDTWQHVFFTYDASEEASGLRVFVDGVSQPLTVKMDSLTKKGNFNNNKPLLLGRRERDAVFVGGNIDELRMYDRRLSDSDVLAITLADQLAPAMATKLSDWKTEQLDMLRKLYLIRDDPNYGKLTSQLDELQAQLRLVESEAPTTLVFRERSKPRDAFVLNRGEYDQPGNKVERKTPEFLPPLGDKQSHDRLGLANWLVADNHPLTSRVAVNRFWQQVFGIGLVETSEDFGSQGTRPSHPDLLDWLAVEFRESGWDVKALMKQFVTSTTYRQSSKTTPDLIQLDPQNRLLAHGPRYRLDAEMLRDQALAISGLLVDQIGGPSVKPPQPAGLWKAVGYSGSNTVEFKKDEGSEKVFRRSLYTFWKRTSPPPQMSTFDAPSRESCTTRRERTNTPLQALLLMNELQYVETARHFGERILHEAGPLPQERIEWAFEMATLRAPSETEVGTLMTAYDQFRQAYSGDIEDAKSLIALGESKPDETLDPVELATWTMMANVLLNLDEVVTKE